MSDDQQPTPTTSLSFEDYHREMLEDPEYAAAYEQAQKRMDEAVLTPCECGRDGCKNWVHPIEGIIGGVGPAGCPIN